ncbi:MAG: hypothetical protein MI922_15010, partial [Bacteroidales bacterium]|nr:hypothetical protein [Bacteroidales bacterium]
MKKLLTIAIGVLVCSTLTMAQETVGGPKAEYPVLKNKLAKSEKNLSNEKKSASPKFWLSRAEVLMDIYNVHSQYVRVGANKTEIQLFFGEPGEKQTITKDGQQLEKYIYERITITYNSAGQVVEFEEINKIHENPLPEAYSALKKAQELDTEGKSGKKIAESYATLKSYLENDAIQCFSKNDFDCSLLNFERIIEINQSPVMEGKMDTVIFYNAGMAASRANKPEKAIEYYEKARELNHNEPGLYVFLKNKYFEVGDTAKGLEILHEGFKKHAGAKDILVELINHYLLNDKSEQALEFLKIAQKDEPENKFYLFAEGTLWDKKEDYEKSI